MVNYKSNSFIVKNDEGARSLLQSSLHSQSGDYIILDDDYVPSLYALPQVSCKTYCIIDGIKGKSLYHKGETEVREIASLTKIMTAYLSL